MYIICPMDETDIKITSILHGNSRISTRELGDILDLSVNSIHKRLNALIDNGVIETFVMGPSCSSIEHVSVLIMGNSSCSSMNECVANLGKDKNVLKIIVGLDNKLFISCIIPNISDLRELTDHCIQAGELEDYQVGIFDIPVCQKKKKSDEDEEETKKVKLTKLDYRIIHSFSKNSRRPISDVADDLNVSPKTVKRRLAKLEKESLVGSGIHWQPTMTNDIITYLSVTVDPGIDVMELFTNLRENYCPNFITLYSFGNLPDFILILFWTKTMREMNDIQQALRKEYEFKSIRSNMQYRAHHFDTWLDDHIKKRAEL